MFCPEGYYSWNEMMGMTIHWAGKVLLANAYAERGMNASVVFESENDPHSELRSLLQEKSDWQSSYSEHQFTAGLISCCLLSGVLLEYEPLLCSSEGTLMRAPEMALLHEDRLDWIYFSGEAREISEFSQYFELFDKGDFETNDLYARFCCLDAFSGLVTIKNNSIKALERSSHIWAPEAEFERIVKVGIAPYVGWSIVWKPSIFPEGLFDLLLNLGFVKEEWRAGTISVGTPKKLGRKSSGAKEEYFKRYENGKPDDITYEAIAAELTEAGFRIGARSVQYYEDERNKSDV